MNEDERQRRIRHYEELARTVSYAPDKTLFQRQADALRQAGGPERRDAALFGARGR